jgi:hypothetical protein
MEMPKPGPAQEKLKAFVGEWRGQEKMHPTPWLPQGGMRDAKISNRLALAGFAVIQDYAQLDDGKTTFEGHAVVLKNPQADNYQMYWFDQWSPSLFEGPFDGKKAVFTSKSPMGVHRATFEFTGPRAYKFLMENSQDGKTWSPMMEGEYQKRD